MTATTYDGGSPGGSTGPIPDDLADAAQSARARPSSTWWPRTTTP